MPWQYNGKEQWRLLKRPHQEGRSGIHRDRLPWAGAGSTGAGSLHSSSAALCQRLELSIVTPPRARLSHEEPEAGKRSARAMSIKMPRTRKLGARSDI